MACDDEKGYHEMLVTAHIMAGLWENNVCGHGLLLTDPDVEHEAVRIFEELAEFYQFVGRRIEEKFEKEKK